MRNIIYFEATKQINRSQAPRNTLHVPLDISILVVWILCKILPDLCDYHLSMRKNYVFHNTLKFGLSASAVGPDQGPNCLTF